MITLRLFTIPNEMGSKDRSSLSLVLELQQIDIIMYLG